MTLESNLTCDVINAPRCDVSDHALACKYRGLIRSAQCSLTRPRTPVETQSAARITVSNCDRAMPNKNRPPPQVAAFWSS